MKLLDGPTRIIGTGTRAISAGIGAAVKELRAGGQADEHRDQPAPAVAPADPAPRRRPASRKPKSFDDVTVARKVETEIFRGKERHALKGHIDVNAVDGVVFLRGVAKTPELINQLEVEANAIPEVKGVENLLHLPHTPAPTRADTPREQQRTRRSPSTGPRREPRSLNADKTVQHSDDLPETLAKERKGRQPAPMGSHGEAVH